MHVAEQRPYICCCVHSIGQGVRGPGVDLSRAPKCLEITSTPYMIGARLIGSLARNFHIGFDLDYECHEKHATCF